MEKPLVRIYTDYKSPYAFVANAALFELEETAGVALEWLPYTLRIAEFMGTVEERTPHFWRKVHYMYMDARRFANAQGLELKGPKRIYDAFYSSAGMLYAQRHGVFSPLSRNGIHALLESRMSSTTCRRSAASSPVSVDRPPTSKPMRKVRPAASTTASLLKRNRRAYSGSRPWSSTASCSGVAIASRS